jgi:hypothetical protein
MKKQLLILSLLTYLVQTGFSQTCEMPSIGKVMDSYLNIKNALVTNEGSKSKSSAKIMLDEINKVSVDIMTAKQKEIWLKTRKKLVKDVKQISETDRIETHRKHFSSLSENMYSILIEFPAATPFYYQYCPMADNNHGAYWLSEQKEIHNPYYGNKMNSCSSNKETIQKK